MCKYVCQNWSFKYKIQYEIQCFGLGSLRDTLCRNSKVNHNLTTKLSITFTPNLSWNEHISNIIDKANKCLFIMKAFKYGISRQALITYYFCFIWPIVEYGNLLFDSCTKTLSDMIENIQLEAAQTATGAKQ